MLLHLIPRLDSESIRMFKDGPLEKLRERGGEFSSRINLFSLLFSLYVFFLRLCINVFWGYLACIKFFPFNFPLVLRPLRLLWYFAPPPPPPPRFHHNFSDNAKIMHQSLCILNRMCIETKAYALLFHILKNAVFRSWLNILLLYF